MAQPTWSYLQNPFDNVTKSSYKLMYLMATDHFDKLLARRSDAIINELYEFGKPSFEAFITQYRIDANIIRPRLKWCTIVGQ